ncbi:hypothetical protein GO988_21450 [Hymenobacter sp. HMF4947]|uniref:Uncharacterized protein n=1 Tax=Hymenobacter ginkgonis TaxID=2682976 RepID=A0A7K1TKK7_9BACT|nr:hypothetical protein [Hymenobacter ginkgonis]MVN78903.1 hypothetical protein [Hymenobacter ginkgonis]
MTLDNFNLLSFKGQLGVVLKEGTFLAQRWVEGFGGVNLYYLPDGGRGFFAEVGIDEEHDCFVVVHSFSSNGPLEDYGQGVQLPEGWT